MDDIRYVCTTSENEIEIVRDEDGMIDHLSFGGPDGNVDIDFDDLCAALEEADYRVQYLPNTDVT